MDNIEPNDNSPGFSACVEKIEAAYEFMLAYAAQGRDREPAGGGSGPSIRNFLCDMETALQNIAPASKMKMAGLDIATEALQALHDFSFRLAEDADKALCVVRMVLAAPTLSSQLVDNLNASVHVRTLLTDIFVLDEALQLHARAGLAKPA